MKIESDQLHTKAEMQDEAKKTFRAFGDKKFIPVTS